MTQVGAQQEEEARRPIDELLDVLGQFVRKAALDGEPVCMVHLEPYDGHNDCWWTMIESAYLKVAREWSQIP